MFNSFPKPARPSRRVSVCLTISLCVLTAMLLVASRDLSVDKGGSSRFGVLQHGLNFVTTPSRGKRIAINKGFIDSRRPKDGKVLCALKLKEGVYISPTDGLWNYNISSVDLGARNSLPTCNATTPFEASWSAHCDTCSDESTCDTKSLVWLKEGCRDRDYVDTRTGGSDGQLLYSCLDNITAVFLGDSTLRQIAKRMVAPHVGAYEMWRFNGHNFAKLHSRKPDKGRGVRLYWNYLLFRSQSPEELIQHTLVNKIPRRHLQDRFVVLVVGGLWTYMEGVLALVDKCKELEKAVEHSTGNAKKSERAMANLEKECPWSELVGGKGMRVIIKSPGMSYLGWQECCTDAGYSDVNECPIDIQNKCAQRLVEEVERERQLAVQNDYEWFDTLNATAGMRSLVRENDQNNCSCHYGVKRYAYVNYYNQNVWPYTRSRMLDNLSNVLATQICGVR